MPKLKTKKNIDSDLIKKTKFKKTSKLIESKLEHKNPQITIQKKEIKPEKQNLKEVDYTKKLIHKADFNETAKMILAGALTAITVFILIFSTFMFIRLERNQASQKREIDSLKKNRHSLFQTKNSQKFLVGDTFSKEFDINEINQSDFEQPNPVLDKWKGDKKSRFVWVQYSDFQCPFCRKIQPDLDKIYQQNPDVAMVYRHYPITSMHPNALNLAIISECSYQIGGDEQFWQVADSFFAYQKQIKTPEQGEKIAILNGVDSKNLADCLKDQSVVDKVVSDSNQANQILENMGYGTPTSVIFDRETNKQRIVVGALPLEQLQFELDCLKQGN